MQRILHKCLAKESNLQFRNKHTQFTSGILRDCVDSARFSHINAIDNNLVKIMYHDLQQPFQCFLSIIIALVCRLFIPFFRYFNILFYTSSIQITKTQFFL